MGDKEVAKVHGWYLVLDMAKMQRILDREIELKNPTVLHQVFVYFHENIHVTEEFWLKYFEEIRHMYCKFSNFLL